jgi:glucuronate isomerase
MLRFRSAVTETAGFSRSSGFIDDTRAFCSIPARHDASRRIEASFLARLVAEHRVSEDRAHELIVDIVDGSPRRVFKL